MKQFSKVISSMVFLVFLLVVLASNPVLAQASKEKLQRVETLMEISGANDLVASASDLIRGLSVPVKTQRYKKAIERASKRSYKARDMQKRLTAELAQRLRDREVEDALSFYRSDLGRQIVKLETRHRSPGAKRKGKMNIAEIGRKMEANTERAQLVKGLVKDLRLVKISRSMGKGTLYAMTSAFYASGKLRTTLSEAQFRARVEKMTAPFLRIIEKSTPFEAFHTYQSVSLEGLKGYRAYLASSSGRRYYKKYMQSFEKLMTEEAENYAASVVAELGKS
ncbi:MAG: DUF2059 domain-containing protein [Pseudomonadota bacterium]